MRASVNSELLTEIAAVIAVYERCWSGLDFDVLGELWDVADPQPIYVPEEAEALFDHAAIRDYWAKTADLVDKASVTTKDVRVVSVADDVCIVFFEMHWEIRMRDGRAPFGGDVRVSAALRQKTAGWRFFHYVEAPRAALSQLRSYHESRVGPNFK